MLYDCFRLKRSCRISSSDLCCGLTTIAVSCAIIKSNEPDERRCAIITPLIASIVPESKSTSSARATFQRHQSQAKIEMLANMR